MPETQLPWTRAVGAGSIKENGMTDIYGNYREKRDALKIKNNPSRVEKMHKAGKLTAEERIEAFFDDHTVTAMWTADRFLPTPMM